MERQSPADSLMKLTSRATNTVVAIKVAKNTRVRNDTVEQHKHCTVGSFGLKQCAQQTMDIMRVIEPRPSPLIAKPDRRVVHDSTPTTAAKVGRIFINCLCGPPDH